jgi:HPt (histidine-containing phosphotransfer) domain-containing protein
MNYPPNSNLSNTTSYNLQDVSTMCRGNKDQILKMIEMFIDQIPKSIEEINTALAKNDIETIKNQLHKSKSTIYFFGASKLADEFITTEAMLSEKFSSSELELKIKNINLLTNEVVEEMKNDFI